MIPITLDKERQTPSISCPLPSVISLPISVFLASTGYWLKRLRCFYYQKDPLFYICPTRCPCVRVSARACPRRPTLPEIESLELCVVDLLRRGMQVILAQVAYDLPIQDGCPWHRVSSALYNGLLGQRASYAAVCEKKSNLTCTGAFMEALPVVHKGDAPLIRFPV